MNKQTITHKLFFKALNVKIDAKPDRMTVKGCKYFDIADDNRSISIFRE
jgi:hypothetical protein